MASNPAAAVAWIALAVGGLGVGLALRAGGRAPKGAETEGEADLLDAKSLENRLNEAEGRLETASRKIRDLEERVTKAERSAAETGAYARATRAMVEENRRPEASLAGAGEVLTPAAEAKKAEIDALLAAIREGKIPDGELFPFFQKAKDLGVLDQALAEMEKYAAAHAEDADTQVDLAGAYISKLMAVPEGMERGAWAGKSLAACEAALKINPEHWSAQFMKGMNLSQWPAFLGKQPEAIKTFEKLVEQQERSPADPKFAQTYYQLGNTWRAAGNLEKARSAFARGLELYPDNKQLREQLETLDKK
jgi:tetratricopeptide (TPR) repeat protein